MSIQPELKKISFDFLIFCWFDARIALGSLLNHYFPPLEYGGSVTLKNDFDLDSFEIEWSCCADSRGFFSILLQFDHTPSPVAVSFLSSSNSPSQLESSPRHFKPNLRKAWEPCSEKDRPASSQIILQDFQQENMLSLCLPRTTLSAEPRLGEGLAEAKSNDILHWHYDIFFFHSHNGISDWHNDIIHIH